MIQTKLIKNLYQAILKLKTLEEAVAFFRDLLTEKEITEMSNRLQAAKMLDSNIPYSVIEQQTGLSSTTVARISKWLNYGRGGYRLIINRLHPH